MRRTLLIAARWADQWNFPGGESAELRRLIGVLNRHCADVGRDPGEIEVSVTAETEADPVAFAARIDDYREASAEHVIVHFPAPYGPGKLGTYAEHLASALDV